jgi:AraC family transcriptional regulator, melibiose operon regulatory protein
MQMKDFLVDQSLIELTVHRTVVLPLSCYETTIYQNINGYIPLHCLVRTIYMIPS